MFYGKVVDMVYLLRTSNDLKILLVGYFLQAFEAASIQ